MLIFLYIRIYNYLEEKEGKRKKKEKKRKKKKKRREDKLYRSSEVPE